MNLKSLFPKTSVNLVKSLFNDTGRIEIDFHAILTKLLEYGNYSIEMKMRIG